MQIQLFSLALALVVMLPACGEDPVATPAQDVIASGQDTQAGVTQPTFLAEGASSTTGDVSVTGSWLAESGHVKVEVVISNFADLFGIAGHLHYDPSVLQLTALQAYGVPLGKFKSTADYTPRAVAKEVPTGRILLGGARVVNAPSPFNAMEGVMVDKETWVTLEFAVLKQTQTTIAFDPITQVVKTGDFKEAPTDWGHLTIDWKVAGGQP